MSGWGKATNWEECVFGWEAGSDTYNTTDLYQTQKWISADDCVVLFCQALNVGGDLDSYKGKHFSTSLIWEVGKQIERERERDACRPVKAHVQLQRQRTLPLYCCRAPNLLLGTCIPLKLNTIAHFPTGDGLQEKLTSMCLLKGTLW